MRFHFGHRLFVNQRALLHAVLQTVAQFQLRRAFCQLGGKRFVNAGLRINAVGADAGLPAVAEFAGQRTFHRLVQIRVVKHDERRVAAQFQAQFFNAGGAFGKDFRARFGGACEADFADNGALREGLRDVGGGTTHDLEQVFRHSGLICQHRLGIRAQRC